MDEKITEEALSKAIDKLIEDQFGMTENTESESQEDISKANGQPSNDQLDQLPEGKESLNANGGKDTLKSEEGVEEEKKEEEEEEDLEKKAKKCSVKKSEEASESEGEDLMKSLVAENKKLKEENESLTKSFVAFKESHEGTMENVGEILKGLKYEIDTLKKTPVRRNSIKNVDEVRKSFTDTDKEETEAPKKAAFQKSEVEDAIESLVKSGKIGAEVGAEFEISGKILNPNHSRMITKEIVNNRK